TIAARGMSSIAARMVNRMRGSFIAWPRRSRLAIMASRSLVPHSNRIPPRAVRSIYNRSITVQRLLRAVLSVDDENRLLNSPPRTKLMRIRLAILADAFKLVPNPVDGLQVDRTIDAALQLIREPLQLGPVALFQEICHGTAVPVGVQRPEY